jgi:hypothetical protein
MAAMIRRRSRVNLDLGTITRGGGEGFAAAGCGEARRGATTTSTLSVVAAR